MIKVFKALKRHTFELGDNVEFEVGFRSNKPRWNSKNEDNGSSGIWATGTIVYVEDESLEHYNKDYYCVKFEIPKMIGLGTCWFPKSTCTYYKYDQWAYPGYLRKIYKPQCVCGSEKVYGRETRLHSFWCEKYFKEKK